MTWTVTITAVRPWNEGPVFQNEFIAEIEVTDGVDTFPLEVRLHVDDTQQEAKNKVKKALADFVPLIQRAKKARAFVGASVTL